MNSTKQQTLKKVLGIVLNVILWAFVIFAVLVTVLAVSASVNAKETGKENIKGVPQLFGSCYFNVQTDSMNSSKPVGVADDKPSGFKAGDLILGKYIYDDQSAINNLEVGDVITFEWVIDGQNAYNTHRIVKIGELDSNGNTYIVYTRGDVAQNKLTEEQLAAEASTGTLTADTYETVSVSRIVSVYSGKKIAGLGGALDFLNTQLGFGLCILLPLVLFFGYEVFVFIRTVLKIKNEGKRTITAEDEELIRQKAIEEYIRQQSNANAQANAAPNQADSQANVAVDSQAEVQSDTSAVDSAPEQSTDSQSTDDNQAD